VTDICEALARNRIGEVSARTGLTPRTIRYHGEIGLASPGYVAAASPDIPWRSTIGMRNVLAHGYFDIDAAGIAAVVERDVPMIARRVTEILEHL